jgi:hypothetical protein
MDDPTRQCENDTGHETRLPGLLVPSGSPTFFLPPRLALLPHSERSLPSEESLFLGFNEEDLSGGA